MEQESDIIIFQEESIICISNTDDQFIKEDDEELEWILEEEPDIYSNNNPFDARTNFIDYLETNKDEELLYVPNKYKHKLNDNEIEHVKLIATGDRFTPV